MLADFRVRFLRIRERKLANRFGCLTGMLKDGLTMFRWSCYICKVPRVNPGLL
jgi:hypothetical protein